MSFVERHFAIAKRDTSLRIEIVGGITSFLAAAYLLVVIPPPLAAGGMGLAFVSAVLFLVGKHE